jgi:hypothetical protein
MALRFDEDALTKRHAGQCLERPLVARRHLQDALVERLRPRVESLYGQVIGDARKERGGALGLIRAKVEIGKRVQRLPVVRDLIDDALVFRDGLVEPPEVKELFGLLQRVFAVERHGQMVLQRFLAFVAIEK